MKTSIFVGTSLDGFLARHDGSFDFLRPFESEPHGYEEFYASVDAVLLGRNTYDVVLRFPKWFYGAKPVFVLSHRPLPQPAEGGAVERLSGTPREVHALLLARGFSHVYVDGGLTVQSFLKAGLVDRLVVSRVPVLIGDGIPLFGALDGDIRLEHLATRSYPTGLVQSEYLVRR